MRWRLKGQGWAVSPALQTLLRQVDSVWPQGGPTDGTLGDRKHAARRSDHNPRPDGEVCAADVDEVVEDRGQLLVDQLVKGRDPRVKYIIHEGKIWRSYDKPGIPAWTPAKYTGSNAHLSHVHISVKPDCDASLWNINLEGGSTVEGQVLSRGDQGAGVRLFQIAINGWRPGTLKVDGIFGAGTETGIKLYQAAAEIEVNGLIDGPTAGLLSTYIDRGDRDVLI